MSVTPIAPCDKRWGTPWSVNRARLTGYPRVEDSEQSGHRRETRRAQCNNGCQAHRPRRSLSPFPRPKLAMPTQIDGSQRTPLVHELLAKNLLYVSRVADRPG